MSFDRLLDGDTRTLGGTAWTVVEGHGHSPEHASLFSRERGVLISGDMLLPKISTNVSVWAPEPDGDPLGRFLDSIATFETLPPDTLVLPSHGLPFRGIAVRVAQLRAHHDARLSELAAAAEAAPAPVSAADVVPVLFRRELDLQQRYFAMGEAIAHLNRLWHAGPARPRRRRRRRRPLRLAASTTPVIRPKETPCPPPPRPPPPRTPRKPATTPSRSRNRSPPPRTRAPS